MPDWSIVIAALEDAGVIVDPAAMPTPVAGGDISPAWRLPSQSGAIFLKTGLADSYDMFAAEAEGLAALAAAAAIRVPRPLAAGVICTRCARRPLPPTRVLCLSLRVRAQAGGASADVCAR